MPADPDVSGHDGAAGSPTRRVAILVFDDVEVLDFAGPFEVFGVARTAGGDAAFEVVTVSIGPGEVVARNDLRVVPAKPLQIWAAQTSS